jgi:hypothetical protein
VKQSGTGSLPPGIVAPCPWSFSASRSFATIRSAVCRLLAAIRNPYQSSHANSDSQSEMDKKAGGWTLVISQTRTRVSQRERFQNAAPATWSIAHQGAHDIRPAATDHGPEEKDR